MAEVARPFISSRLPLYMRFTVVAEGPRPSGITSSFTTSAPETVPEAPESVKGTPTTGSSAKRRVCPQAVTSGVCSHACAQNSFRESMSFQTRHSPSASSTGFSPAISRRALYSESGTSVTSVSALPWSSVSTVALPE